MSMPFKPMKAIQASAVLLKTRQSRRMSRLRLLKLLYIADRESLVTLGRPITGDRVVAMRNGPVLSGTYDMIKGEDSCAPVWEKYLRNVDNDVELTAEPGVGKLSKLEIEKLQEVAQRFEHQDEFDLSDYTHGFAEWIKNRPEGNTAKGISWDDIFGAVGLAEEKGALQRDLAAESAMRRLLA